MQSNPNINAQRISGQLQLDMSTTTESSLNLIEGVGPTTKTEGDIFFNADRLKITMSDLSIESVAFLSDITGGGGTPTLTQYEIPYGDAANLMTSSNAMTYDGTTYRVIADVELHTNTYNIQGGVVTDYSQSWVYGDNVEQSLGFGGTYASYKSSDIQMFYNYTPVFSVVLNNLVFGDPSNSAIGINLSTQAIIIVTDDNEGIKYNIDYSAGYTSRSLTDKAYVDGQVATKQNALSGTGFVKISGSTISYDNSTYITASSTNTLTNKSGNISQWTNDSNYITASSSNTLTNKTGNISQWTNNSGYITASSSSALTNKTGNISQWTNDIGYGIVDNTVVGDDIVFWDGNSLTSNPGQFQYNASVNSFKHFGGVRFNYRNTGGGVYNVLLEDYTVVSNTGGTINLPQCSSANLGHVLNLKNISTAGASLLINAFAGDNIDSNSSYALGPMNGTPSTLNSIVIQSTGSGWVILSSFKI